MKIRQHLPALLTLAMAPIGFFHDIFLANSPAYFGLCRGDFLLHYYPWRCFAANALATGRLPLWNPTQFCGTPFAADPQAALFYPFNLLLNLPGCLTHPVQSLQLLILLHFFLAGLGMFCLVRLHTKSDFPALFAGLIYMFNGYFIAHATHISLFFASIWLPWLLLIPARAHLKRPQPGWPLLPCILLLSILAGHPQTTLYQIYAVLLFSAFAGGTLAQNRILSPRSFLAATTALVAGMGLAALQILPGAELIVRSVRSDPGFELAAWGSFPWQSFRNFFVPDVPGQSESSDLEFRLYLGLAGLILAGLSISRRQFRHQLPMLITGLTGLLLALDYPAPVKAVLCHILPGYAWVRLHTRAMLLPMTAIAFLAGCGMEQLRLFIEGRLKRRRMIPANIKYFVFTVMATIIALSMADLKRFEKNFGRVAHSPETMYQPWPRITQFIETHPGMRIFPYQDGEFSWNGFGQSRHGAMPPNWPMTAGLEAGNGYNPPLLLESTLSFFQSVAQRPELLRNISVSQVIARKSFMPGLIQDRHNKVVWDLPDPLPPVRIIRHLNRAPAAPFIPGLIAGQNHEFQTAAWVTPDAFVQAVRTLHMQVKLADPECGGPAAMTPLFVRSSQDSNDDSLWLQAGDFSLKSDATTGRRGVRVAAFTGSGDFQWQDVFDTYQDESENRRFLSAINGLPDGSVVVTTSVFDASKHTSPQSSDAFSRLGLNLSLDRLYRWAFCGIGVKNPGKTITCQILNRFQTSLAEGYPMAHIPAPPEPDQIHWSKTDGSSDINLTVNSPGILMINTVNYPGWFCHDDNGDRHAPITLDGLLQGYLLPAGMHRLKCRFEPVSFRLGLFMTLMMTLGGCLAMMILLPRKAKKYAN